MANCIHEKNIIGGNDSLTCYFSNNVFAILTDEHENFEAEHLFEDYFQIFPRLIDALTCSELCASAFMMCHETHWFFYGCKPDQPSSFGDFEI
jgi:hypothetical protein